MPTEPVGQIAHAASGITGGWQLAAWVIAALSVLAVAWMFRLAGDGKKLVAKSDELEAERTAARKAKRDQQIERLTAAINASIAEVSKRVDVTSNVAEGVGKSLDRHIDEHKGQDERTQKSIMNIDDRLRKIEANLIERKEFIALCEKVNETNTGVVRIMAIMEERAKHERN